MTTGIERSAPSGGPGLGEKLPFGFLGYLGAAVSVFFCYAQVLLDLVLPPLGLRPLTFDIHLQAVLIWGFALLAVIGLYRDFRIHGSKVPLGLGILGLLVIVATLYGYYDVLILIFGYLLLVAGVLHNPALRLVQLNRSVQAQAAKLAELNRTLENRVESQVGEIERLARLKRFLSSEVADLILTEGKESLLDSHRRLIACLFCDIRNFTSFSEGVEPEDVMNLLQAVHEEIGRLAAACGGTIGFRAGDGVMVIFNDPLPCDDPVRRAVALARDIDAAFAEVRGRWHDLGHRIGLGIGISYGYATLGLIGTEGRRDYTAIGNAVNMAARLCDRAQDGMILLEKRAYLEVEREIPCEAFGRIALKGLSKEVEVFRVAGNGR